MSRVDPIGKTFSIDFCELYFFMSFSCFESLVAIELILFCNGLFVLGCSRTHDWELAMKTIELCLGNDPSLVLIWPTICLGELEVFDAGNFGELGTIGCISLTCFDFDISRAFYCRFTKLLNELF